MEALYSLNRGTILWYADESRKNLVGQKQVFVSSRRVETLLILTLSVDVLDST